MKRLIWLFLTRASSGTVRRLQRVGVAVLLSASCLAGKSAVSPPILPTPPNASLNVPSRVTLAWSAGDLDLVANGGFETGNFNGWVEEVQAQAGRMGINDGLTDPDGQAPEVITPPLAGKFNAISVPMSPGRFGIYQDIAIPVSAAWAELRWLDRVRNFEANGRFVNDGGNLHTFRVELRNPANNQVLATMFQTEDGDPPLANWTKRSFDLTPYRGQTVRVAFVTYVFLFFFSVHLDQVSLNIYTATPPTNDVYFGTSALSLQGSTTTEMWSLPPLEPATAYQWRIIRRLGSSAQAGPIWTFSTGTAGEVDQFTWNPVGSPQVSGLPFSVTLTARDAKDHRVSTFQEPVSLSAVTLDHSSNYHLLGDRTFTSFAGFRRASVGYAFTPDTDLYVHAVRSMGGDEVTLWTDQGVRLASVPVVNNDSGIWTQTALPNVVRLEKGRSYRLSAFSEDAALQYARFEDEGVFAHGTIDQSFEGRGHEFPTTPHPARWWFVDLVYRVGESPSLSVTPMATGPFVHGQWTGNLAITGSSTSVVLRAEHPNATGASLPFGLQNP